MQIIRSNNSTIGKFGVADFFRGKSRAAFTMVELAVVLVIIALMMGQFIKFSIEGQKNLKEQVTKEKIAFIMQAIEDYAKANNRIPCPADGSLLLNDAEYGLEDISSGNCDNISSGLSFGVVPIHELNIDLKYMTDGWGRKFSYIIDEDLTSSLSAPSNIEIRSINDSGATSTSNASVVVISHGENGFGAWNARGGSTYKTVPSGADLQAENTDRDDIFIQNFLLPDGNNAFFDDIVEYRESYQLVN